MADWKSLVVCVCTPTDVVNEGVYGTGVPVRTGLILTARHVVRPSAMQPPKKRHPNKRILVRWWYAEDPEFNKEWVMLEPDEVAIVWESAKFDAALLKVRRPECAVGTSVCSLSCQHPVDGMRWYSEGFPEVYAYNNDRSPQSCGGTVYSKATGEDFFEITADPVEEVSDWSGASGMPVMVDDRVLGVVLRVPKKMRGERLHAAPMWKLLQESGFREAIEPLGTEKIRAAASGRLKARLSKDSRLLAALKSHSSQTVMDAAKNKDINEIVRAFLDLDVKSALKGLYSAWKAEEELQASIQALAVDVTAALSSQASLTALHTDHEYDGRGIVVSDLGTLTSAELAIAAWLNVAPELLPKRTPGDYPPGRFWIPLAPECGEGTGEQDIDAVCKDIEYRDLGDFAHALDERLTQTEDLGGYYAPTIGRPLPCLKERKNVVRDRFEDEAELGERCPYLAFVMPENTDQREHLKKVIEGVRAFYKPVLALALDAERELVDRSALAALRLMLP